MDQDITGTASWLMQSGKVTPWEAADFLAMSEKGAKDIYAHLHPEQKVRR
jgi:hypothetical protein